MACGYYVSTVLKDAGFRVDRYKLAQQPSGNIIRSFLPRSACQLKVGEDYDNYADWVESQEDGIYLIGLDTHVGFIVVEEGVMSLLHSSGKRPRGVVEEKRSEAGVLRKSNWRMIGKFTADKGVIRKWLGGDRVNVHS